jgi:hypothetical protein
MLLLTMHDETSNGPELKSKSLSTNVTPSTHERVLARVSKLRTTVAAYLRNRLDRSLDKEIAYEFHECAKRWCSHANRLQEETSCQHTAQELEEMTARMRDDLGRIFDLLPR